MQERDDGLVWRAEDVSSLYGLNEDKECDYKAF